METIIAVAAAVVVMAVVAGIVVVRRHRKMGAAATAAPDRRRPPSGARPGASESTVPNPTFAPSSELSDGAAPAPGAVTPLWFPEPVSGTAGTLANTRATSDDGVGRLGDDADAGAEPPALNGVYDSMPPPPPAAVVAPAPAAAVAAAGTVPAAGEPTVAPENPYGFGRPASATDAEPQHAAALGADAETADIGPGDDGAEPVAETLGQDGGDGGPAADAGSPDNPYGFGAATGPAAEQQYATVSPAALVGATGDSDVGGGHSTLEDQRRALEENGGPKIYEAVHADDADDADGGAAPLREPTLLAPTGTVIAPEDSTRTVQPIYESGMLIRKGPLVAASEAGAVSASSQSAPVSAPEWLHPATMGRRQAEMLLQAQPADPDTMRWLVRSRGGSGEAPGSRPSHALSLIGKRGEFVHRKLDEPRPGHFEVNGRAVLNLGNTLAEAIPIMVAQSRSKYGYQRSAPVANDLGTTEA